MKWYIDGYAYLTLTNEVPHFDVPYYVILNTALGGSWPGPVGEETELPAYHRIDYVRVARVLGKV
jgi:beta-glucanase (GH16 family)